MSRIAKPISNDAALHAARKQLARQGVLDKNHKNAVRGFDFTAESPTVLKDIGPRTASALEEAGLKTLRDVLLTRGMLNQVPGVTPAKAEVLYAARDKIAAVFQKMGVGL